jgi:putative peptidoglycan lipid II flippase
MSQPDAASRNRAHFGHTGFHAVLVATGIFLSRVAGLVRQRVFAHYFGNSAAADAFTAAFRIPNFLQNLFGEGVLSASFIPVYTGLLSRDEKAEADRVAGVIGTLLALVVSILVLFGVLCTPMLIALIAPGFTGATRELAIRLVRILFPGAGFLVLSAWCLGILNSHRRFFLSYTAPVLWNLVMIGTLLGFGGRLEQFPLAAVLAWGSVAGSALQFSMQLPFVLRLARNMRPALEIASANVRTIVHNFLPVCVSRGVVQISAYIDSLLATLLPTGSVAALGYAQLIYTLPVSLFGMSVAAAELPAMSSAQGSKEEIAATLRTRLQSGLRRIAFFVVPSAAAFLTLGDVIAEALYRTGRFTHADALWAWGILAGSAVGLLASTLWRLYASAYYALHDTRTPLRFAIVRVVLTTGLGVLLALYAPQVLGIDRKWGVAGLTSSAGLAGWIEFLLLRRALNRRIGATGLSGRYLATLWVLALLGAAAAWGAKLALRSWPPIPLAAATLLPYGGVYMLGAMALKLPEASIFMRLLRRPARG